MSPIQIRPYNRDDLNAIIEVFNDSVRQVASRHYSPAQIDAWAPIAVNTAQWSERLERKPTFIAEYGSHIAGFSDLEPTGQIDMLFVHSEYQGLGIARRLLNHILLKAREQNHSALTTDASITARPFFERSGFHVVQEQDVQLRGQTFKNYRMARAI
ncbi:GNAT family N-acetyltransferase [Brevundimonas sp.]|uniref:GNAT family N-acetyltransferase n=1 Tax=Brevundimonas sp. TaxID=1871086 RepID=UPI0035650706